MWQVISKRLDPRSTVLSALSTVLFLSLACSMSMQYGHADTPIAASADLDYQILSDADAHSPIPTRTIRSACQLRNCCR